MIYGYKEADFDIWYQQFLMRSNVCSGMIEWRQAAV